MLGLELLAEDLGVSGRTLRRCVTDGLIRAHRPSPHKLTMASGEERYLREHWHLLGALRAALRTEPNVRVAVLFGSYARGESHEASDVDLLVSLRDESSHRIIGLGLCLGERLGLPVQIAMLSDAHRTPAFLAEVVRDGRALLDRDGEWRRLLESADEILARGARAAREQERAAWRAVDALAARAV